MHNGRLLIPVNYKFIIIIINREIQQRQLHVHVDGSS